MPGNSGRPLASRYQPSCQETSAVARRPVRRRLGCRLPTLSLSLPSSPGAHTAVVAAGDAKFRSSSRCEGRPAGVGNYGNDACLEGVLSVGRPACERPGPADAGGGSDGEPLQPSRPPLGDTPRGNGTPTWCLSRDNEVPLTAAGRYVTLRVNLIGLKAMRTVGQQLDSVAFKR